MDSAYFDHLTRIVSIAYSRRGLGGALGIAALAAPGLTDAKKKKHKRKRKKECKDGTKKCGKQCIAASACCSSAGCGNGATCVNGACTCPNGFKDCAGACIAEGQCCGRCPGETVCVGGDCVCPDTAPNECPGGECLIGGQCCKTSECPNPQECFNGLCQCPEEDDILCVDLCCDGAAKEVCKLGPSNHTCQAGGCPATNICADFVTERFVCAIDFERACFCTSTVDQLPGKVCVASESLVSGACEECNTSSQCGAGRVCVADGPGCNCGVNFCVNLCSI